MLAHDNDEDNLFLKLVYHIIGAGKVLMEISMSDFELETGVKYKTSIHGQKQTA